MYALLYAKHVKEWHEHNTDCVVSPSSNKLHSSHNIIFVGHSPLFTIQYDYYLLWQLRQSRLLSACCRF